MQVDKEFISIVSPVYQAEKIVTELVKRISGSVSTITENFEIILVEDGSPDNSWETIGNICNTNQKVKGIKLSKNFGQHYAISAGLEYSKGDYVIVMDCDLQDNPKYIPEMIQLAKNGNDIVYTIKDSRKHSFLKNFTAKLFFRIFNFLSDNLVSHSGVGGYSLLSRKVVNEYCKIRDCHRHYLLVLGMLGFKSAYLKTQHEKRYEGKSSYTFSKLFKHAINGITSQSDKLLRLSITLGFILFLGSLAWATVLIFKYFFYSIAPGYTSLMVFMLLSTALILMSIGIAGIYIGKIFEQVKNRPLYIVDEAMNCNPKEIMDVMESKLEEY